MEGNKKIKQLHEKYIFTLFYLWKNMFFKSEEFQNFLGIVEEKNVDKVEKHKLNGALV